MSAVQHKANWFKPFWSIFLSFLLISNSAFIIVRFFYEDWLKYLPYSIISVLWDICCLFLWSFRISNLAFIIMNLSRSLIDYLPYRITSNVRGIYCLFLWIFYELVIRLLLLLDSFVRTGYLPNNIRSIISVCISQFCISIYLNKVLAIATLTNWSMMVHIYFIDVKV